MVVKKERTKIKTKVGAIKKVPSTTYLTNKVKKELEDQLDLIEKLTEIVKSQQLIIDKIRNRMGI